MLPLFHPKVFAQQGKSRIEGIPHFLGCAYDHRCTLCISLDPFHTSHSKLCDSGCRIMKHAGGEYVDLGEGDEGVEGEGGEGDAELEAEKLSRLRRDVLDDLEIPGSPGVEVRI